MEASGPIERRFNPYTDNGGTVLGVAGEDFAVIASDTRLSEYYSIHARDVPKLFKLTPQMVLGCAGFHGDVLTLTKEMNEATQVYQYEHGRTISTPATAEMLSKKLYYRRFFPFYTYNVLVGLDTEGKGAVYGFDPIGSFERETFRASGSAASLLQPLLDNQIGYHNQPNAKREPLSRDKAVALVREVFSCAAERDIQTGDGVVISVITKDGVKESFYPLRSD
ncbi:proteasome subunit beta type-1-B-like [Sycon ciliatum]|uniref:proteasome subunit beta type-1-B-like n=1 Tax=Sycon ciliatum TaxID=27933 RepID=UPI0020AB83A4|eukprot:scpid52744/ scgid29466/ Proteasome subunit beta type-1-B; 20S proteasome beta-6 subunit B